MNILVIEDNDIKYGLVWTYLHKMEECLVVKRASSYQSGLETLMNERFDWVILDMTLPVYDFYYSLVGADVLTFGGELILRESMRKNLNARFIVLSQYSTFIRKNKEVTFEELKIELLEKFKGYVVGCVRLDRSSVQWENELNLLIKPINENPDC